jgi:glucose-1-phosphate thymidylyltransferase
LDALILAAGDGTRLQPYTAVKPKVMIEIWGVPALERLLYALKESGIKRAVIVVSYKKEIIQDYFGSQWQGMDIVYREVDYHDDGILRSAIKGKDVIDSRFVFVCGDTILEPETVKRILTQSGDLVVGVRNEIIDESVGAKVDEHGNITKIGMLKDMKDYNRVVTGLAVADPIFFTGMEQCIEKDIYDRPCAMQWMIDQNANVTAFDMTEDSWCEIDDESDLEKAKKEIFERSWKRRLSSRDINVFKLLFNLPISLNLVKLISRTRLKPNHLNLISLGFALLSGISFLLGFFIPGGIFAYSCTMVDAMDGKLSRLKLMSSPLGGFYDSVCDRGAEILIVSGLAGGLYRDTSHPIMLLLGLLAIAGWIGRFYIKELFIHMAGLKAWKSLRAIPLDLFGHRDVSFFVTMVSCIMGYPLISLLWMVFFGNCFAAINFMSYRKYLKESPIREDYASR